MRIQLSDLRQHLKGALAPLYCVVGEEPFLQWETLTAIRTETRAQDYKRECCDVASATFDWENFKYILKTNDLFSPKRLFELHLIEKKISRTTTQNLVDLAHSIPPNTILLLCRDQWDSTAYQSTWFSTLDRIGITLWTRPLSRTAFSTWLSDRIQQTHLTFTEAAFSTLLERIEGNVGAAAQAIERLMLHTPPQAPPLLPDAVLDGVADNTRFTVFDLIDSLLEGAIARIHRIFSSLKHEAIEPLWILWSITREIRTLLPIAQSKEAGMAPTHIFRQHGVWKHKTKGIATFLARTTHPVSLLQQALTDAKDVDMCLKGQTHIDPWSLLLSLCLRLACGMPPMHNGRTPNSNLTD